MQATKLTHNIHTKYQGTTYSYPCVTQPEIAPPFPLAQYHVDSNVRVGAYCDFVLLCPSGGLDIFLTLF